MGLGSGIQKKPIPDPESRGQKGTRSRILFRNTDAKRHPPRCLCQTQRCKQCIRIQHFRSMRIRIRSRIQPTKITADPCRSRSGTLVADPEPGSGAFSAPGLGIQNGFFPDPRSGISDPKPLIFESLVTIL